MNKKACLIAGVALCVFGGCQQEDTTPAMSNPVAQRAERVSTEGVIDHADLPARAQQALQQQRLVAPGGDNAVEFYLAARERSPGDAAIQAALIELQPYVLIATEQALDRGDAAEATRLLGLMQSTDPRAPSLARLRTDLHALAEQARLEGARPASITSAVAPPPTPAASVPAVARTDAPSVSPEAAIATPIFETPDVTPPPASPATPISRAEVATAPPRVASVQANAAPRLLQDAQPRYPLPALRNRIEGRVDVAFVVRPDGSVSDIRLVSAQPEGLFDASALAVAARWRFEPSDRAHPQQRTVHFRLPR